MLEKQAEVANDRRGDAVIAAPILGPADSFIIFLPQAKVQLVLGIEVYQST